MTGGGVAWTGIAVFSVDLLAHLRPYLEGFVLGRCLRSDGSVIPSHATCYTRHTLLLHGDQDTKYWTCTTCGLAWSYTPFRAARYVLRGDLSGAVVYQDDACDLYIADTIARRIDWSRWPDLELEWVEIRDEPGSEGPERSPEAELPARTEGARQDQAVTPPTPIVLPGSRARRAKPSRNRLAQRFKHLGADRDSLDALMELVRAGFRLVSSGAIEPLHEIPLGVSRLGGLPDLPPGAEWPRTPDGRPMSFLAQLNLAEAQGVRPETPLPPGGQLYFFYDAERQPAGYNEQDRGFWRVLTAQVPQADLRRAEPPDGLAEGCHFHGRAVRLEPELFLPSPQTLSELLAQEVGSVPGMNALRQALRSGAYGRWFRQIGGGDEERMDHRFLGHPHEVQSAMPGHLPAVICEDGDGAVAWEEEPGDFEPDGSIPVSDWRLLLQLSTTGGAGWNWGDGGRLYFWVPRSDLRAWRFERVWVESQYT